MATPPPARAAAGRFSSFGQLELESAQAVPPAPDGMPPIQLSLGQLQASARALLAGKPPAAAAAESAAAARLLARQGVDAERLDRDVRAMGLRPEFGDVFPSAAPAAGLLAGAAGTVDDYLRALQQSTVTAAIGDLQRANEAAAADSLAAARAAEWGRCRRQLTAALGRGLATGLGLGGGGLFSPPVAAPPLESSTNAPPAPGLVGRAAAYGAAVEDRHVTTARGRPTGSLGASFGAAVASLSVGAPPGESPALAALASQWSLVASLTDAAPGGVPALVAASRRHLESGHAIHIESVIARSASTAALAAPGAVPGVGAAAAVVQAFLRVKLAGRGPLDFDASASGNGVAGLGGSLGSALGSSLGSGGGALDTTWAQVYYHLRSGTPAEAAAIAARASPDSGLARGLAAWATSPTPPVGPWLDDAAAEGRRWLRSGATYAAAVAAALTGDRALGDAATAASPALVATIEDYMWLKLAMVRESESQATPLSAFAAVAAGSPAPPGGPGTPLTVAELASHLRQYGPSHYTRGGRAPLLYSTVLLLALQPGAAAAYLATDPAAAPLHAIEGAHLAAAVAACPGLRAIASSEVASSGLQSLTGGGPPLPRPSSLIQAWAADRADAGAVSTAVAFLPLWASAAASEPGGGGAASETGLLRDALRQLLSHVASGGATSAKLGILLGAGGAVAAAETDPRARAALASAAAADCESGAHYGAASALYAAAGRHPEAVSLAARRWAEAILAEHITGGAACGGAAAASAEARAGELQREAAAAVAAAVAAGAAGPGGRGRAECDAVAQLTAARALLAASRSGGVASASTAVGRLPELPFLPLEPFLVDQRAAEISSLHPALALLLPELTLAGGRALAECARTAAAAARRAPAAVGGVSESEAVRRATGQLAALAAFAGAVGGGGVPVGVAAELARLAMAPV